MMTGRVCRDTVAGRLVTATYVEDIAITHPGNEKMQVGDVARVTLGAPWRILAKLSGFVPSSQW